MRFKQWVESEVNPVNAAQQFAGMVISHSEVASRGEMSQGYDGLWQATQDQEEELMKRYMQLPEKDRIMALRMIKEEMSRVDIMIGWDYHEKGLAGEILEQKWRMLRRMHSKLSGEFNWVVDNG